ncbi:MAG TPA: hypothetical protein VIL03_05130, partial [Clostridia bacterium]
NLKTDTLSSADLAKFKADLKELEKYNNAKPYEYAKLYAKLKDFWFIKYLYYNDAYNVMLFTKLREHVEGNVTVTEEEVVNYYDKKLAEQQASFDANIDNYISALKDNKEIIIYHPQDVKWFYVKHILIPFSDEQKAKIENYKKLGLPESAVKAYRDSLANQITSYMHVNGNNYGERLTLSQIESHILSATSREKFERLIYLYNTDPGMFDSVMGYGMQYTYPKTGTSGYMLEFEAASFRLYENGQVGAIEKAITDYGVHYIMLYSIVKPETKALLDWTNDFGHEFYGITIKEALRRELLDSKKADAYTNYQNKILKQLNREWEPYITLYPKRYNRLIKLAKG